MIDKKVVQFVDRCVAKEYQRHKKKYDAAGFGEVGALLTVRHNLEKSTADISRFKNNQTKGNFLIDSMIYASRVDDYYQSDYYDKRICKDEYYSDRMWEHNQ